MITALEGIHKLLLKRNSLLDKRNSVLVGGGFVIVLLVIGIAGAVAIGGVDDGEPTEGPDPVPESQQTEVEQSPVEGSGPVSDSQPAEIKHSPVENADTGEQYDDVQDAIDAAGEGDTIRLRKGVHEYGHIIFVDKPLTLTGESGTVVQWDGGDRRLGQVGHTNGRTDQSVILIRSSDVVVENIHIDGMSVNRGAQEHINNTAYGIDISARRGGLENVTIRDVTVENTILEEISAYRVRGLTLDGVSGYVSTAQMDGSQVDAPDCEERKRPDRQGDLTITIGFDC